MINLHESMGPGRDRTRDPWICSQTRICCQTRYRLRCAPWNREVPGSSLIRGWVEQATLSLFKLHIFEENSNDNFEGTVFAKAWAWPYVYVLARAFAARTQLTYWEVADYVTYLELSFLLETLNYVVNSILMYLEHNLVRALYFFILW